jgi:disulfide bond formation protein DsbB
MFQMILYQIVLGAQMILYHIVLGAQMILYPIVLGAQMILYHIVLGAQMILYHVVLGAHMHIYTFPSVQVLKTDILKIKTAVKDIMMVKSQTQILSQPKFLC